MMYGQKRHDLATGLKCKECSGDLTGTRSCTQVFLDCKKCGKRYILDEFSGEITEELEDELAYVPIDRL